MADLIDREKLLCALYQDCHCMNTRFLNCVRLAPSVNRWISCNEKFPEEEQDVIIYIAERWKETPIQIAHILHDNILWELSDGEYYFSKDEVSHWMPLPEKPETTSD